MYHRSGISRRWISSEGPGGCSVTGRGASGVRRRVGGGTDARVVRWRSGGVAGVVENAGESQHFVACEFEASGAAGGGEEWVLRHLRSERQLRRRRGLVADLRRDTGSVALVDIGCSCWHVRDDGETRRRVDGGWNGRGYGCHHWNRRRPEGGLANFRRAEVSLIGARREAGDAPSRTAVATRGRRICNKVSRIPDAN